MLVFVEKGCIKKMASSHQNDAVSMDRKFVHHSDKFHLNLGVFMQLCKNELQFILAYVIHQKDNAFPDELQHLPFIPALRYQQSQNSKITMAPFALLDL